MKQIKNCINQRYNGQIVVGGDSVLGDHRAGEDEDGGKEARFGIAEAPSPANHEERESAKKSEMDQGGSGVVAEGEGHQEQHLGTLGKVGVHAGVVPGEAVMVPHANYVPQVVAGAVGVDAEQDLVAANDAVDLAVAGGARAVKK